MSEQHNGDTVASHVQSIQRERSNGQEKWPLELICKHKLLYMKWPEYKNSKCNFKCFPLSNKC